MNALSFQNLHLKTSWPNRNEQCSLIILKENIPDKDKIPLATLGCSEADNLEAHEEDDLDIIKEDEEEEL